MLSPSGSPAYHFDVLGADDVRHAFPPHMHEEYAIAVTGKATHRLWHRGRVRDVHPGTVVALNPRELHAADPTPSAGWSYRMLYISDATMRRVADVVRDRPGPVVEFDSPTIDEPRLARAVVELCALRDDATCTLALEEHSIRLLAVVLGASGVSAIGESGGGVEPPAVSAVRDYLHEHFGERVRLSVLADLVNLNPCYLIRAFRRSVGIPPHAYLAQVRVARAQSLLSEGRTVSDAALAAGFSDQSHLTRHFRRSLGITPGAYVRDNRRQRPLRRRARARAESIVAR